MRIFKVARNLLCWLCLAGVWLLSFISVSMADQDDQGLPSSNEPVKAAKRGIHVFHDRVTTFVDAQLTVLKESGLWEGEPVGIVFVGINQNRWEQAWEFTQGNFQQGKHVVAVPTYHLLSK